MLWNWDSSDPLNIPFGRRPNDIFVDFLGSDDLSVSPRQLPTMTGPLGNLGVTTSQECFCPLLHKEGTGKTSRGRHRCTVSSSEPLLLWFTSMASHLNFILVSASPAGDNQVTQ